ncbi:MAG: protein translocase SEC61 complex subunit gamma [Candidatus Methylarchaceae archaeon HK01B]|nr:protein translocase SEC61 complex subunit gamma [Candidatus Methylarchaceae archaeon HK01M]MCP8312651.1 protein translocase SEC61 complex subunit gamma [Candidatus Methylarchaceae archaeon HK02M1]MCP8318279.1 protein translocase SEC61 complex subunit gamma [Candidatus Methylarchaceae archaeon HK01B]
MGVLDLMKSIRQMLRLTKKSDWGEFRLYIKLTLIGVAAIGAIGFIIKIIGSAFKLFF